MIKEQGLSVHNVSESMSIGQTALRRWRAQHDAEQSGQPGKANHSPLSRARGAESATAVRLAAANGDGGAYFF
jgi:transposase-like protein